MKYEMFANNIFRVLLSRKQKELPAHGSKVLRIAICQSYGKCLRTTGSFMYSTNKSSLSIVPWGTQMNIFYLCRHFLYVHNDLFQCNRVWGKSFIFPDFS